MELLFWVLDLFPKPFVVFVFLLGIIVMLDVAGKPSTEEKENLDRKKNGAEEAKLADIGRRKVGAARKSKKKQRVKFVDDVGVRKANDVEVSEKPGKDFELSDNVNEKVGFLPNLSDGRLVVERGEGSTIMEDVGDIVVVRKVDHFGGSDKPIQVFELSEDVSEKVGFLDMSLEERLDFARDEDSNIAMDVHQFEAGGVDKELEGLICGEKSAAGECGDVNVIKDSKGAGARGEESKNIGLLVRALDRGVADEKNEIAIIGDYCGVKGEGVVIRGLEGFVVEQGIQIDAVGGEDGLTSMNDNVRVEERHDVAGERIANNTEFFEEDFVTKALDGDNGLKFINEDALIDESDSAIRGRDNDNTEQLKEELLEREGDGENGMAWMNEAVVTDERDTVVEKRVANSCEILEEKLDREAVDSENGMTLINGVVQIDESDAAAGERVAGQAKLSEEDLEREVVEEKSEHTVGDLDMVYGGEECNIHLGRRGLENLVVEEVIQSEESCSESRVELVSDSFAYPQIEVGRVGSDNAEGKTGIEEGFSGVNEGAEGIVGDQDVVSSVNNDYDDDWEGVERSELEKDFAEAVNYVEYGRKTKDDELRSDVQMILYGLHKLAVEGPCHVPQPIAFKVSARAKW